MHLHIISLFPEIFDSFLSTSLLQKAQEKKLLSFHCINPRKYCTDKHQQIDDQVYGGGAGMLIKAQPIIDAVEEIINNITETSQHHRNAPYVDYPEGFDMKIIFPSPSVATFTQKHAYAFSKIQHLIFICGRYEGIDHRFEEYMETKYPTAFQKISLGQFVLLGGEVATMTMIEAITRLVPWVIKESESRQNESYNLKSCMTNLEEPQYTRPEEVYGFKVPEVLLTGNQKGIQARKEAQTKNLLKISPQSIHS